MINLRMRPVRPHGKQRTANSKQKSISFLYLSSGCCAGRQFTIRLCINISLSNIAAGRQAVQSSLLIGSGLLFAVCCLLFATHLLIHSTR